MCIDTLLSPDAEIPKCWVAFHRWNGYPVDEIYATKDGRNWNTKK